MTNPLWNTTINYRIWITCVDGTRVNLDKVEAISIEEYKVDGEDCFEIELWTISGSSYTVNKSFKTQKDAEQGIEEIFNAANKAQS